MNFYFQKSIAILSIILGVTSCSQSSGGGQRINPAYEFYKSELPFLVNECDAKLFENAASGETLIQRGYQVNKIRTNKDVAAFKKSGATFPYVSTATISLSGNKACKLDFSISGVGGSSFNLFKNALAAQGYKGIRTEKYGTFNQATRIIMSNGERTIAVTGRSTFQNGIGNLIMSMFRV